MSGGWGGCGEGMGGDEGTNEFRPVLNLTSMDIVEQGIDRRVPSQRILQWSPKVLFAQHPNKSISIPFPSPHLTVLPCFGGTNHHTRDPTPFRIPLLPQVDIIQLHPHHVLLGRLEVLGLFRVGLDLCDPRLGDLGVGRAEKGREGEGEGVAGVVGEGEVDVGAGEGEELGEGGWGCVDEEEGRDGVGQRAREGGTEKV